jgi:hypothetical protein
MKRSRLDTVLLVVIVMGLFFTRIEWRSPPRKIARHVISFSFLQ